ncbi:hypothetical protein [Pseudomonas gingeri]|uniref:hypothetical protein n=1 Tax=Pseudomonas gingeri TaxID=117681 RepID=UPI0015A00412|nr:hypothetical protein [Pseudomonas gingeri]NWE46977.1 hypothetical protein [Pseudomonas gingeri]
MFNSIAKKILGSIFLLLSLLCAVPASAAIVTCTGALDFKITPGLVGLVPNTTPQVIQGQASVVSATSCATDIAGTKIQPARLAIDGELSSSSCLAFTLKPNSVHMNILWDNDATGTAEYTGPSGFPLVGPLVASFLITSGPEVGGTLSITAVPPASAALAACLLGGPAVKHLGVQYLFSVAP